MTEKLTACQNCRHEFLEGEDYACFANPFMVWDAHLGREKVQHYGGCSRVNTDGHCPYFKEKE